jgi:hypothetical protein
MADAFYITMHNGAQAAADVFGVDLLFQGAPKFDAERQISVLNADSFHQVEPRRDTAGLFWGMIVESTRKLLLFGCAILFIGI